MITSSQNPLVKQVRQLQRSRRAREAEGLFVVEGIQGVLAALESGAAIRALLWAPDRLTSALARERLEGARAAGVRVEAVGAALFESLSARENPAGLLALVERRLTSLDALAVGPESLFVALVGVADPGNLGTILRSLDAVGGDALLLVGETVDPFHPTTVKASASALFAVPMAAVAEVETLLGWAAERAVAVVATSDGAAAEYWSLDLRPPLLLLMGSEAHGLAPDLLERLPTAARIPMAGRADSLNLGVATSLLLYEVRRQQRAARG